MVKDRLQGEFTREWPPELSDRPSKVHYADCGSC